MVTEEILEPYLEKSLCIDGRMIPLFMFEEIFSYICYRHRITAKNCSPIIVAGDERETKIILKKLGTDKNRLTIVTSTPELYENYTDYMYNEYGLLVIRSKSPISSELYGNIVIELRETSKEEKKHYRKDSVVINLTGKKQTMFNRQKEKNIKIYDQFSFLVRGQKWDNKILQAAIFKTETGMGLAQLENAEKIKEVYGIMLEKDL